MHNAQTLAKARLRHSSNNSHNGYSPYYGAQSYSEQSYPAQAVVLSNDGKTLEKTAEIVKQGTEAGKNILSAPTEKAWKERVEKATQEAVKRGGISLAGGGVVGGGVFLLTKNIGWSIAAGVAGFVGTAVIWHAADPIDMDALTGKKPEASALEKAAKTGGNVVDTISKTTGVLTGGNSGQQQTGQQQQKPVTT